MAFLYSMLIAPDGDAKIDNWNKDGAITAIVVLEDGADPIAKGGELVYGTSETAHLIEHDRQNRPSSGNYSLGGSGATDYVANGNKGLKLWYFNVRYDLIAGKRFQVARMNPTITAGSYKAWNITNVQTFSDANITKVWKVELAGSGGWSNFWFSGSAGNTLSSESVSYVLEGYMTCSPSPRNGYMAYPGLKDTYSLEDRLVNTTTLRDFDDTNYGENTYGIGRQNDSGEKITTVGAKVTKMKALYEAATTPPPGTNATNKTLNYVNIIVIISLIGLTSLFGIYILKRKPKKI